MDEITAEPERPGSANQISGVRLAAEAAMRRMKAVLFISARSSFLIWLAAIPMSARESSNCSGLRLALYRHRSLRRCVSRLRRRNEKRPLCHREPQGFRRDQLLHHRTARWRSANSSLSKWKNRPACWTMSRSNEYINRLGQNLVRNSDVKIPVSFHVIDQRVSCFHSAGRLRVHRYRDDPPLRE